MIQTVWNVNLYAADETLWATLSAMHPTRRGAEKEAKRLAVLRGDQIRQGMSIRVEEAKEDLEPDYEEDCPEFWEAQDRRAFDEEKISFRHHRPSEY